MFPAQMRLRTFPVGMALLLTEARQFAEQSGYAAVMALCDEKIADPVGMEDFSVADCTYQYEPRKSMHPAYHFRMSARDMARFGVMYQQNGTWQGERLIPGPIRSSRPCSSCRVSSDIRLVPDSRAAA